MFSWSFADIASGQKENRDQQVILLQCVMRTYEELEYTERKAFRL